MKALLDVESTVRPGHVLGGKYRVESVLGVGGMGVVVAARHVELDTRFALKLMRRDAARDEESVERFLREARAAVRLKSEHCVQVVDVGKLADATPYMVMEFLVGRDMADLVAATGARPPAEAVDYILQACEGIAEAHALGIVHRDIKPQNLFVTTGVDGKPLVKVLDFGLAKTLKGGKEVRALTQTTAVMGSPQYMSPEQMRASRQVDVRSDNWSLGVCLYELLTGRTPFDGETYPELCSMVLNSPPDPMPSDIPRGLMKVVTRCLQKDPRRRYRDVAELAEALEPFASARGAAERIRAVLDRPRPELDPLPLGSVHDPDMETKTSASLDTARRAPAPRSARWPAIVAGGIVAGGIVLAFVVRTPSASSAAAGSALAAAAAPPPRDAPAPPLAFSATSPLPVAAASDAPSKAEHPRASPARRSQRPAPTSAASAQPKPGEPVLKPKTTEF